MSQARRIVEAEVGRDSFSECNEAEEQAKRLLSEHGFEDLAAILHVIAYDKEEVGGADWVGQYVAGSVDSEHGLTVLVNADAHEGVHDMIETINHEVGHALWELLDDEGRAAWGEDRESFADNLMWLCAGIRHFIDREELWMELIKPQ